LINHSQIKINFLINNKFKGEGQIRQNLITCNTYFHQVPSSAACWSVVFRFLRGKTQEKKLKKDYVLRAAIHTRLLCRRNLCSLETLQC